MSLLKEVSKLLKKFKKKYFSANSLFYIDKLEKLKNQMGGGYTLAVRVLFCLHMKISFGT